MANPRYFDFADRRIRHLVNSGMVSVIVGGWGRPQGDGQSTLAQVGLDGFKRHWRNLIARYGAYPTVWNLFWSFMLSAAASIWQASVDGDPGIDSVYDWTTWREGMAYPGSTQLGIGKKLLEQYPWSRFEVHPEWVPGCYAAGIPGNVRFVWMLVLENNENK